jgi:hypothetical protein
VSHWVTWHQEYEDPASPLSLRLRLVREAVQRFAAPGGRTISICAGQGRDLIGLVDAALLVELDPELCAHARVASAYEGWVPADLVLVCGVFGNVTDVEGLIARLPTLCAPGATVIWTRHRRPPDLTPAVRRWLADAGFEAPPDPYVLCVGAHRLVGAPLPFDPALRLFEFTGDGSRPA